MIEISVTGLPAPQGSKRRVGRGFFVEDNERTAPWRAAVAAAATKAMGKRPLYAGALRMQATFTFPRPKTHFGTGRNQGQLKPNARYWYVNRPDLDKLVRAVGDALTGVVCLDDACISELIVRKVYGAPTGVQIIVTQLEGGEQWQPRVISLATPTQ